MNHALSGSQACKTCLQRCGVQTTERSAHDEAELAALMRAGRDKLHTSQLRLELGLDEAGGPAGVVREREDAANVVEVIGRTVLALESLR